MVANQDTMAQGVYMAQLAAARSTCKCDTCRILRKTSAAMIAQFIAPKPEAMSNQELVTAADAALVDPEE